jgi:hypothetical protein
MYAPEPETCPNCFVTLFEVLARLEEAVKAQSSGVPRDPFKKNDDFQDATGALRGHAAAQRFPVGTCSQLPLGHAACEIVRHTSAAEVHYGMYTRHLQPGPLEADPFMLQSGAQRAEAEAKDSHKCVARLAPALPCSTVSLVCGFAAVHKRAAFVAVEDSRSSLIAAEAIHTCLRHTHWQQLDF